MPVKKITMKKQVVLFLAIIALFGCNKTIDRKISSGYLESFWTVYYAPMGNSFELGIDELPNADIKTFKPISEDYGKDAKHVYYTADLIKGADPLSFRVGKFDYAMDKNHAYYSGVILDEISSEGFSPLSSDYLQSGSNYYYKKSNFDDMKTVSVDNYKIPTALNHHFKIIDTNLNLSTDGISVFYYEFKLPLIFEHNFSVEKQEQADGPFFHNGNSLYFIADYSYPKAVKSSLNEMKSSLGIINSQNKDYYLFKYDGINAFNCNNEWAIINNNALYYIKDKSLVFVAVVKAIGFLFSSWSGYAMADDTVYYYDGNVNVFHQIIKIDNSQKDFKVMNDFYAKNSMKVYYQGKAIQKADATSFKVLTPLNGYDKKFIYERDSSIMDNTESNLEKIKEKYPK